MTVLGPARGAKRDGQVLPRSGAYPTMAAYMLLFYPYMAVNTKMVLRRLIYAMSGYLSLVMPKRHRPIGRTSFAQQLVTGSMRRGRKGSKDIWDTKKATCDTCASLLYLGLCWVLVKFIGEIAK